MNKEDIHIISRHSNWSEEGVEAALKQHVYSSTKSWNKFLQLLFMSLGVGFTVSGILFFFAYNWAHLHKFAKLGLVEGLIILVVLTAVFSKLNQSIKDIILTGAAALVGVLFAVYGQIYQTGANAYDFFLGWTVFITIWVVVSNYPPLWLLFLTLINTTFVLYTQQVAQNFTEVYFVSIVFVFNALCLIGFLSLQHLKNNINVPLWFTNVLALAVISISTIGISTGIFNHFEMQYSVLLIAAIPVYVLGIIYGYKYKRAFYLSIIPFSLIIIICALLIKASDGAGMFFTICLFVIASISGLIASLIHIQKKWNNEPIN